VAGSLALAVATAVALAGNSALASAAADANSGSWGSAQRRAQVAARWEPWSAEPRFLLGEAQLAVGDHKAARQSFAQALALDSDDWRTWYELARVSGPDVQRIGIEEIARLNPMSVRLLPSPAYLEGCSAPVPKSEGRPPEQPQPPAALRP
jgi:tetratricopeptide (TPR) repeat protein